MSNQSHKASLAWQLYSLTKELIDVRNLARSFPVFFKYFSGLSNYRKLSPGEEIAAADLRPMLGDRSEAHPFDPHYFYQDWWASNKISIVRPAQHLDVGSNISFVSLLSNLCDVTYVDLRPLEVSIPRFRGIAGDVTKLPFEDDSRGSISCLHVVEHVGLGRYGDKLDPEGSKKACRELERVLAPGGNLLISTPIGRERVCFNAHRIHSSKTILSYCSGLDLKEFSGVDDRGGFAANIPTDSLNQSDYGCGMFWFTKKK